MNPAETLRAAATQLRCDHIHPVNPPEGSLTKPGDCRRCGAPFDPAFVEGIERVTESLAALFEATADQYEQDHGDIPHGLCRCFEGRDPVLVNALAVARSVTGGKA